MTNMEKSELVIAKILSLLMDWGGKETQLEFEELELGEDFAQFFFPCVNWLIAEGVIRTGKIVCFSSWHEKGKILTPSITAAGMAILGGSISIGESQERLGDVVKKVSNRGANYTGIGDFFGGMLGGFTKSLGN